ncbi:Bifunctional NAD(P)H-hydrate repair enzyme Nnr [bioreactor metagenome]|uniref:Bifunctional NAD(P)H-hydrate repair enzyme Nnr n=1 Tax=bioreactor metagenome TaxID=1076179 RepID=A0A645ENC9_9ZZZZ
MLGCSAAAVQANRLAAAQQLAEQCACIVVLKGSGSIIAAPGHTPFINPTGNARLATGGTGDVLAGLLGARLAALPGGDDDDLSASAVDATRRACWQHGQVADQWSPADGQLTASGLARALTSR